MYLYPASPIPFHRPNSQLPRFSTTTAIVSLPLVSICGLSCAGKYLKDRKCFQAETMKQSLLSGVLLLFFLILISSSHLSARFIANKQGKEDVVELSQITDKEDNELMNQLMGVEACESGADECLQRRAISEAHLDYIYTQQQKP